jgi:PIN domain nuclease of toxin-antitoxin system
MRYLLDTDATLWFLEDSERLSEQAAKVVEDSQAQSVTLLIGRSLQPRNPRGYR